MQEDSMQKEFWYLHQDIKGPCWCGWSLLHVGWCTVTWVHVGVHGAYYSWGQHLGLWPWSVLPPNVIGMLPPESYADAVNVHGLCCHTRPCWIWVACAEIWSYVMSVVCAAHWDNVDIHGLGLTLGFMLVFMAYVILKAILMFLPCAATEGYDGIHVLWFSREQCWCPCYVLPPDTKLRS